MLALLGLALGGQQDWQPCSRVAASLWDGDWVLHEEFLRLSRESHGNVKGITIVEDGATIQIEWDDVSHELAPGRFLVGDGFFSRWQTPLGQFWRADVTFLDARADAPRVTYHLAGSGAQTVGDRIGNEWERQTRLDALGRQVACYEKGGFADSLSGGAGPAAAGCEGRGGQDGPSALSMIRYRGVRWSAVTLVRAALGFAEKAGPGVPCATSNAWAAWGHCLQLAQGQFMGGVYGDHRAMDVPWVSFVMDWSTLRTAKGDDFVGDGLYGTARDVDGGARPWLADIRFTNRSTGSGVLVGSYTAVGSGVREGIKERGWLRITAQTERGFDEICATMDYALTPTGHVQTWNLHTGDAWVVREVYTGEALACTEMSKNGDLTTPVCTAP